MFKPFVGIFDQSTALAALKPGTKFWTMFNYVGRGVVEIVGPLTVEHIELLSGPRILTINSTGFPAEYYLQDLTNRYHGIFLSESEAMRHFTALSEAYRTDPELIAELEQERNALHPVIPVLEDFDDGFAFVGDPEDSVINDDDGRIATNHEDDQDKDD